MLRLGILGAALILTAGLAVLLGGGLAIYYFTARAAPQPSRLITFLLPLDIAEAPYSASGLLQREYDRQVRRVQGGGIAGAGKGALVLTNERFFHLDIKAKRLTPLPLINLPRRGRSGTDLRYNDVLAREGETGYTVLVSFTHWDEANQCFSLRIARADFPSAASLLTAAKAEWRTIFIARPCLAKLHEPIQAGGRMIWDGETHFLLATGEYGYDDLPGREPAHSQLPRSDYGKLLRIDAASGERQQIALGLRNPQGLARDKDGRIWSSEHGPRGGDELNLLRPGQNYGWPRATYGTNYGGFIWPPETGAPGRHDTYQKPVFAWTPATGIANVEAMHGFAPQWEGDLLVSSLKGKSLFRLRLDGERVVLMERIYFGHRIRDTYLHPAGLVVLGNKGRVFIVRAGKEKTAARQPDEPVLRAAFGRCLACHGALASLDETGLDENGAAPDLQGFFARPIASADYAYSPALAAADGYWDQDRLARFIADPQSVFPGSTMPPSGFADPQIINGLAEFLVRY